MAVKILEQHELYPAVSAEKQAVRQYPLPGGSNAAHLLGYLRPVTLADLKKSHARDIQIHGSDLIGATGLEASYDSYLRGESGLQVVSVDAGGGITGTLSDTAPVPGANVVTSLDARVQRVLEQSLANAMTSAHHQTERHTGKHYAGDTAAGVVIDARTGHVVAMASLPTYNPNIWVGGISQKELDHLGDAKAGQPILDRVTNGEFAPGSTFKLITTAGVVHEGRGNFSGTYFCPGSLKVGNSTKHNFEGEFGGHIGLHQTIVQSCDTVYYQFAIDDWFHDQALLRAHKKPVEGVQNMARAFGLGRPTGIDLPTDLSGLIEDRAQKLKDWNTYIRKNACAGAKRRAKGSYLQRIDEENCKDGWVFREGDQANFDIGQGTVLVTPLQLAVAYEALVNGGRVVSPRIGKAVVSPAGALVRTLQCPTVGRLPVSQGTLGDIMSAMYDVTRAKKGTATGAFKGFPFGQVAVGGKTGTADVAHKQPTSWFASFGGPAGQAAQYVVVTMVTQGGQGAATAAPAARAVWDGIYGLEHHPAALAGGVPPKALPVIAPDGTVHPPGTHIAPQRRTPRPGSSGTPGATPLALPPAGRIRAGPYS
jgi:penicillin-binding protein 2